MGELQTYLIAGMLREGIDTGTLPVSNDNAIIPANDNASRKREGSTTGQAGQKMVAWTQATTDVPDIRPPDLPYMTDGILRDSSAPFPRSTTRLTENAMTGHYRQPLVTAQVIRAMGLPVDDYGTGFSSLSDIANLTVNEPAIDQGFVKWPEPADKAGHHSHRAGTGHDSRGGKDGAGRTAPR